MSGSAKPGSILNSSGFMVIFPPFFTDIPLVRMLFKIISSKIVIFSDSSFLEMIIYYFYLVQDHNHFHPRDDK